MNRFLVLLFYFFSSSVCWSYESLEIDLDSGTTLNVTQFSGEEKTLLLWLPSERGFGPGYVSVAMDLSILEYAVWAVQLHNSYIIPTGRNSLDEVDIDDLIALIDKAKQLGYKEIYLVSSSRGVLLGLKTAYLYQQLNKDSELLKGLVLFSPQLVKGRTQMGQDAEYENIASVSNLPIFLLQPQYGTKFARSEEISTQLQQGGSPVFMQVLRGTQAGFYMRPDEDLTPRDLLMRDQLPQIIDQAVSLLRNSVAAKLTTLSVTEETDATRTDSLREPTLHPFSGNKHPPLLKLKSLENQSSNLKDLQGNVVLLNFWATWCGPCVEEIPSLSRLVNKMKGKPFRVVAVNVGETPEIIQQFIKSIPVNFEILLDSDGRAVRDWKVYAYPSNFLLDKNGQIQFAYRGALEWDSKSIVKTINTLIN